MLYQDTHYITEPVKDHLVVFACDPLYWKKYGKYLAKSCDLTFQDFHIHFLGYDDQFIDEVKSFIKNFKVNISISAETIPSDLLEPQKIAYFYTARYFSARDLLKKFNISELTITDADLIFRRSIKLAADKEIGFSYKKHPTSLFHSVQGNIFLIKNSKVWFLDKMIENFLERYFNTDWNAVANSKNDETAQNLYGLDQVCIAHTAPLVLEDTKFVNIGRKLIDKLEDGVRPIWTLTNNKDQDIEKKLKEIFGF